MLSKLGIILALALVLRIGMTDKIPPELFGDEIDVGYQSFSLLKTGKDLYRQILPIYVRSLSEPRAPLLMYATVPSVAILGLNEYGVRTPEVVFGVLGILIFFILTRNYMAATVMAIVPWHIIYSRAAFEVVLMLDLIMLGVVLAQRKKEVLGFLFFALAMYTYSTAIVFVPLFILAVYRRDLWKMKRPFVFFTALLIPLVLVILTGDGRYRFERVGILGNSDLQNQVYEMKNRSGLQSDRFFYNKYLQISSLVFSNYVRAFSPDFLFIRGDPVLRHSIQVSGGMLPIMSVFIIPGLYLLAKNKQWLWLIWFFLAPVPSALTYDGANHATRLFLMLPPICLAVAWGILKLGKTKFLLSVICFLIALNFVWVSYYYINNYPKASWQWWHVGFAPIMKELSRLDSQYSRVFINNTYEPSLERFLFWTKYPPDKFHKNFVADQWINEIAPGYNGFKLGEKYYFGDFSDSAKQKQINNVFRSDSLYVVSQRDNVPGNWDWWKAPPSGTKVLAVSKNPLGIPIFYLVTGK
jgi:hypothetical protein